MYSKTYNNSIALNLSLLNDIYNKSSFLANKESIQISPLGFKEIETKIIADVDNNFYRTRNEDTYEKYEIILKTKEVNKSTKAHNLQIIKEEVVYDKTTKGFYKNKIRYTCPLHLFMIAVIENNTKFNIKIKESIVLELLSICEFKFNNYKITKTYIDKIGMCVIDKCNNLNIGDLKRGLEDINVDLDNMSKLFYTDNKANVEELLSTLLTHKED